MSRFDYFSVGYDGDFMSDRARIEDITNTPENKRELPCDGCAFIAKCSKRGTECSAFRNWASTGDFKDGDLARYIR